MAPQLDSEFQRRFKPDASPTGFASTTRQFLTSIASLLDGRSQVFCKDYEARGAINATATSLFTLENDPMGSQQIRAKSYLARAAFSP